MTTEVVVPEKLQSEVLSWPEQARALSIKTQADYEGAAALLVGIKGLRKRIDETFDPVVRAAHDAHKKAVGAKKDCEAPLVEAEGEIKRRCGAYVEAQEKIRREEQRRLEAEARKRAEELRIQAALELEAQGRKDEAEEVIETPVVPVRVMPSAPAPRAAGVSSREVWSAELVDKRALVAHVASRPELLYLLEPNMTALNGMARMQKEAFAVPGVEARRSTSMSARAV